jgi:3-isopropylmalate/(R)-2-methylmalate dehydratase small subunit
LLPIVLDADDVNQLFHEVETTEGYRLAVNLQEQTVTMPGGKRFQFDIDSFRKHSLLNGLDEIGLTLQQADKIRAFEEKHRVAQPWLFA